MIQMARTRYRVLNFSSVALNETFRKTKGSNEQCPDRDLNLFRCHNIAQTKWMGLKTEKIVTLTLAKSIFNVQQPE